MSNKDSTWTKSEKELWTKYSVANPFAKLMKITDIEASDLGVIYKITGITKSRKMVKDTTGKLVAKYPEQWMVSYKLKGNLVAFVTYDDPLYKGKTIADVIGLMGSGLHQGDDKTMNAKTKTDIELAPSADENVEINDEF